MKTEKQKLIGIVGSCRKVGNSEIVAKAVGEALAPDWELELIRLPSLNIRPCKGCYACLIPGVTCNIDDDMAWFLERICGADALLFSVPNYILGPIGMVKMLTDRALQTAACGDALRGKRTAVALTLGREDYRGYADTVLTSQVSGLGLEVVGTACFYGTHPGEVALDDAFERRIAGLVAALRKGREAFDVPENRCPRCLSDLFRIHPRGLQCACCRALATRDAAGALSFFYFDPEFSPEGQREHLNWLQQKKGEYALLKDRLKAVQERYRRGAWLVPPVRGLQDQAPPPEQRRG
jgi:multimeric flavodoxin WrbA